MERGRSKYPIKNKIHVESGIRNIKRIQNGESRAILKKIIKKNLSLSRGRAKNIRLKMVQGGFKIRQKTKYTCKGPTRIQNGLGSLFWN